VFAERYKKMGAEDFAASRVMMNAIREMMGKGRLYAEDDRVALIREKDGRTIPAQEERAWPGKSDLFWSFP